MAVSHIVWHIFQMGWEKLPTTVDGSEIRLTSWGKGSLSHNLQGFYVSQVVVWDFFHQQLFCFSGSIGWGVKLLKPWKWKTWKDLFALYIYIYVYLYIDIYLYTYILVFFVQLWRCFTGLLKICCWFPTKSSCSFWKTTWHGSVQPDYSLSLFARPELLRWQNMMQIRPNTVVPEGLTITCQLVNSFLFPLSTSSICVFPHISASICFLRSWPLFEMDGGQRIVIRTQLVKSLHLQIFADLTRFTTSFQIWYINKNGTCFKLQGHHLSKKNYQQY